MSITPLQDPLLRDVPIVDGYKVLEPTVLVEKLPEGGMAAVYRGLHLDLKVDVAVKVLKRGAEATGYSPQAVGRFRQEAEQAARLNDPNLVRIYDFPANKIGLLYLVMEFVDGETLESRVQRKGRLSPHEAVTIAYLSAKGLQAAHGEGVVHRDIKPPNILLSKKGQVKLTDLGIAKASDSAAMGMTQEITLLGTPQYMSPELWRGARFASQASDVYALGATVAFMLTGRHVLDGPDTQEIMHRTLTQGFPDVARIVPGVPPQLDNVVRLCTAQNPADRVPIEELMLLLRELLELYRGEMSLADPKAGSTMQASIAPTRMPSRGDLTRIREELDRIKVPTPPPGTLVMRRDTPGQAVAAAGYPGAGAAYPGTGVVPGGPSAPRAGTYPPPTAAAAGRRPPTLAGVVPGAPPASGSAVTRVNLYGGAGMGPGPGGRSARGGRRRPTSLGKRLVRGTLVLGVLGGAAAGGWLAVEKGWLKDAIAKLSGGPTPGGPTGPATTQSTGGSASRPVVVVADKGSSPDKGTPSDPGTAAMNGTPGGQGSAPSGASAGATKPAPQTGPAGGPNDSTGNPKVPGTPGNAVAIVDPHGDPPPVKAGPDDGNPDKGNPAKGTRPAGDGGKPPADAPPVKPVAAGGYAAVRDKALAAGGRQAWADLFPMLKGWREAAEGSSKRDEYVADVDGLLMAFRAGRADLTARRREYPDLPQQLAWAVGAGSGPAALMLAEAGMDVRQLSASRRVVAPADPRVGLEPAVRNLEFAANAKRHVQAATDAATYLPDAMLGQLEYLTAAKRWPEMFAWLDRMQVGNLRAAAAAPNAGAAAAGMPRETLERYVAAANRSLLAFRDANAGPDKVRAGARDAVANQSLDLARVLGPYADAGSPAAALVAAESLLTVDTKTGMLAGAASGVLDAGAAVTKAADLLQKARSAKDTPTAESAGRYLVGAYAAAAKVAADRKAWGEAVMWLARARAVATGADAPAGAAKQWREAAGETVVALRAAYPNLDDRRKALPALTQDLAPLADAGVFAARLALAEQTIGYEGDPPRAVPRGGDDATFARARLLLAPCISSEECPPDVKREAVGREWDILAVAARQLADTKPPPGRLADALGQLAARAGYGGRQKEYDALVDELLPADDAAAARVRVGLAERQLDVGEHPTTGLRAVRQTDKRVVAAARGTLEGLRQSANAEVKAKACTLLGDVALLDDSPQSQAKAYVLYKEALAAGGRWKDPAALVGIGWFYRLPDDRLAPLAAAEPALGDVQRIPAADRAKQLLAFYREAAFSGDAIALFVAGQYLWQFPETRKQAEGYLQAAYNKGHKVAAKELARLRNGGGVR